MCSRAVEALEEFELEIDAEVETPPLGIDLHYATGSTLDEQLWSASMARPRAHAAS
jgi:hypothetical protein